MLEIKSKLKIAPDGTRPRVDAELRLPFAKRRSNRVAVTLAGEPVEIALAQGEMLRGGDLLLASDGRVVQVMADAEGLFRVEAASPALLAQAAYRLGSNHVPVEISNNFLLTPQARGVEAMLKPLGVRLRRLIGPFEPE